MYTFAFSKKNGCNYPFSEHISCIYVLIKIWLKAVTDVRSEKYFDICREKAERLKAIDYKKVLMKLKCRCLDELVQHFLIHFLSC